MPQPPAKAPAGTALKISPPFLQKQKQPSSREKGCLRPALQKADSYIAASGRGTDIRGRGTLMRGGSADSISAVWAGIGEESDAG